MAATAFLGRWEPGADGAEEITLTGGVGGTPPEPLLGKWAPGSGEGWLGVGDEKGAGAAGCEMAGGTTGVGLGLGAGDGFGLAGGGGGVGAGSGNMVVVRPW